ncbi:MAG: cupredoxin domain-containing protein [Salinibacter sp.]
MLMTQFFSMRRLGPRIVLAVGLAVVLAAFGGRADGLAAPSDERSPVADTIQVTMTDHAYEPSDLTVPAGEEVTLQFVNEGTVEHYFVVGETVADSEEGFEQNLFDEVALVKNKETPEHEEDQEEEHEEEEEHHENEFELSPGGRGTLTFRLPASKAGTYTIACFETTGNRAHYEMGMTGTLTVTTEGR